MTRIPVVSRALACLLVVFLYSTALWAQKGIDASDKIVFVYYKARTSNLVIVPNFANKLASIKIYKRSGQETDYVFITEKKKPAVPLKSNKPGPYSIRWEDAGCNTPNVDYKIVCYDKKGQRLRRGNCGLGRREQTKKSGQ